ncbi:hypothetical protein HYFRA_00005904 [Hymenoscyphus fraxineus]|uniref:Uncharacterized protein n=1 Tax=Hymenoscyphus fraxineus TaxID=746836 RepID=A0A9N9KX95_9HELO|nr:hypothetical protein HYFRA_00005904 [Hymenoscyphus fraxineus]
MKWIKHKENANGEHYQLDHPPNLPNSMVRESKCLKAQAYKPTNPLLPLPTSATQTIQQIFLPELSSEVRNIIIRILVVKPQHFRPLHPPIDAIFARIKEHEAGKVSLPPFKMFLLWRELAVKRTMK